MNYKSNYKDLNLKENDEIWAYAFFESFQDDPDIKPKLNQPPILGIIQKTKYNSYLFVPYKKNKNELATSRAIDIESRRYATSEKNAWYGYQQDILYALNQHALRMTFIQSYLDNIPDIPKTLRIVQNGIDRLVCDVSPIWTGNGIAALPIYSTPNINLYPACILPNLWTNTEWFIESKNSSELVTNITPQTVQQTDIFVEGYDKDNDLYEPLFATSSVEEAYVVAASWLELQHKTDMFRSSANEPYDWFIVNDHNYRNIIC